MYSKLEQTEVLQQIDQAHEGLFSVVAGLPKDRLDLKPASGGWSVMQVVEHVAIVEDRIVGRIQQLLESPAEPAKTSDLKAADELLRTAVLDRSVLRQAPEFLHPTGQPVSASLERLTGNRKKLDQMLQSVPPDFRQRSLPHPFLGPLDSHQWLITMAGHCVRHTQQILQIQRGS